MYNHADSTQTTTCKTVLLHASSSSSSSCHQRCCMLDVRLRPAIQPSFTCQHATCILSGANAGDWQLAPTFAVFCESPCCFLKERNRCPLHSRTSAPLPQHHAWRQHGKGTALRACADHAQPPRTIHHQRDSCSVHTSRAASKFQTNRQSFKAASSMLSVRRHHQQTHASTFTISLACKCATPAQRCLCPRQCNV